MEKADHEIVGFTVTVTLFVTLSRFSNQNNYGGTRPGGGALVVLIYFESVTTMSLPSKQTCKLPAALNNISIYSTVLESFLGT